MSLQQWSRRKKFNGGKSKFTDTKTGKKWTVFPDDAKALIEDTLNGL